MSVVRHLVHIGEINSLVLRKQWCGLSRVCGGKFLNRRRDGVGHLAMKCRNEVGGRKGGTCREKGFYFCWAVNLKRKAKTTTKKNVSWGSTHAFNCENHPELTLERT